MSHNLDHILDSASVIPVLALKDINKAAPLAKALYEGGLKVIELTLRTPIAIDAMKAMHDAVPELIIGMGTITEPDQVEACIKQGAQFLVSPGLTPDLASVMVRSGCPCLPGVSSASEAMAATQKGFAALKFFPAEPAGGIDYLKSLSGPLPDLVFCPTGGIGRDKAGQYLALNNVACVGGSWVATSKQIETQDWDAICDNARFAAALKN